MIVDIKTGVELFPDINEITNTYLSPIAAYEAWAGELGLNPATDLGGLIRADDGSTEIDVGFITTIGGNSTKVMQSSEGSIAVWLNDSVGISNTSRAISGVIPQHTTVPRAYQSRAGNNPPLIFNFKNPTIDSGSWAPKWNKTLDTAIIYCEWASYGSQSVNNSKVAIRLSKGEIEIVCMADAASTGSKFQIFMMDSTSNSGTAIDGNGNFGLLLSPNVVYTFTSVLPLNINGHVTDVDGQPTSSPVRAYYRSNGNLAASGMSDQVTGYYSLQVPDGEYYVVCLDSGINDLNALILDRVIPVE
ncbi:hypothetical protein ACRWQN_17475 [Shewanella sp. HL-SH8]|uniref:hypothetical protein n=1 Tax=Shewanella sp. HL-SH8 TaxID=3436242 RepID=UPI003EB6CACC